MTNFDIRARVSKYSSSELFIKTHLGYEPVVLQLQRKAHTKDRKCEPRENIISKLLNLRHSADTEPSFGGRAFVIIISSAVVLIPRPVTKCVHWQVLESKGQLRHRQGFNQDFKSESYRPPIRSCTSLMNSWFCVTFHVIIDSDRELIVIISNESRLTLIKKNACRFFLWRNANLWIN